MGLVERGSRENRVSIMMACKWAWCDGAVQGSMLMGLKGLEAKPAWALSLLRGHAWETGMIEVAWALLLLGSS